MSSNALAQDRLREGQRWIPVSWLNRLPADVEALTEASCPHGATDGMALHVASPWPRTLFAVIVGTDGGSPPRYDWELLEDQDGVFILDPSEAYGDYSTPLFPARELNDNPDVPMGATVELLPGRGGEHWWFNWPHLSHIISTDVVFTGQVTFAPISTTTTPVTIIPPVGSTVPPFIVAAPGDPEGIVVPVVTVTPEGGFIVAPVDTTTAGITVTPPVGATAHAIQVTDPTTGEKKGGIDADGRPWTAAATAPVTVLNGQMFLWFDPATGEATFTGRDSGGTLIEWVVDLTASGGGGSTWSVTAAQMANYAAAPGELVLYDTSGGGWTLTLPDPGTCEGRVVKVKESQNNATALTVDSAGGATIDGNPSISLAIANAAREFISDGAKWRITGGYL